MLPRDVAPNEKLRIARETARPSLTQREMADKAGVSRTTYANWEAGLTKRVPVEGVRKVAAALDVDEDWFYDGRPGAPTAGRAQTSQGDTGLADTVAVRRWCGAQAAAALTDEDEMYLQEDGEENVPSTFLVGGSARAANHDVVRVSGNSMSPRVDSGERVLMHRDPVPRPNVISLLQSPEGRGYLKVLRTGAGGRFRAESVGPLGARIDDLRGWRLLGYAVAILGEDEPGKRNVEWRAGAPLRA